MVRHLDERDGTPIQDIWAYQPYTEGSLHGTDDGIDADVAWMGPTDPERLGYPTQKPDGLLGRIILASSNPGDLVLDPFCGCGTAVFTAHRLDRRWIGIDITHLAINLIKYRLRDGFGDEVRTTYKVIGEPVSVPDAAALADEDPFQFQCWALGLVHARPTEQKKGADKGIDGRLYFHDEKDGTHSKQVIFSVKGGNVSVSQLRDLRGVVEREKAAIGCFLSMQEPTQPMRKEAASAGFYKSPWDGRQYPRLQLLTIEQILVDGARVEMPPTKHTTTTFRRAGRAKKRADFRQTELL